MESKEHEMLFKLEEEIIDDKLKEGAQGLKFLLDHSNETDMHTYPTLLQLAGVWNDPNEWAVFVIDSLKLSPDHFYDKYQINFWIARSMNLQKIADIRDGTSTWYSNLFIRYISNKLEE